MARKGPEKNKSGFLKRAFRKSVFGVSLLAATGCGATLHEPTTVNDNLPVPCGTPGSLSFSFSNAAAPILMGEKMTGVFGDDEYRAFSKWSDVLGRHAQMMAQPENVRSYNAWLSRFDSLKDKSTAEKVVEVSRVVDLYTPYEKDEVVHGAPDYWATPMETIIKRMGDCDDIAILKYFALRHLDVPAGKMHVVIVDDQEGNPGRHMTLIVDVREQRTEIPRQDIFDGTSQPLAPRYAEEKKENNDPPPPARKSYSLYFAMNETGVWYAPRNTVPHWGASENKPPVCLPNVTTASAAGRRPTP